MTIERNNTSNICEGIIKDGHTYAKMRVRLPKKLSQKLSDFDVSKALGLAPDLWPTPQTSHKRFPNARSTRLLDSQLVFGPRAAGLRAGRWAGGQEVGRVVGGVHPPPHMQCLMGGMMLMDA